MLCTISAVHLKPSKVQVLMTNQELSVARLRAIQDLFGLGKGQELMKEGQLYTLCLALADELEGECEKRKANKCLRIILDPEVLEDAHLAENQFTVVLVSAKEKIAVEKLEEFSASSFASFKSVPGKRPTQQ